MQQRRQIQERSRHSGRWVIGLLIVLVIATIAFILWLQRPSEDDQQVIVPTVRPTITETTAPTDTPSPIPTATLTSAPTNTPSPTPNVLIEFATSPPTLEASTAQPTLDAEVVAEVPAQDFPPLPAPVEIALNVTAIPGNPDSSVLPNYGRYGGLYDNAELIRAGHIMINVPQDPDTGANAYSIDVFEVTNLQLVNYLNATLLADSTEQWNAQQIEWVADDASIFQNELGIWAARNRADLLPVHGISALTARAYCANIGGNLPTLDQWEHAAFWEDGQPLRPYPWGSEAPDRTHANFAGDAPLIGNQLDKGKSWIGVFNMAGNVAEWIVLADGTFGVIGGSFLDDATTFENAVHTVQPMPPNIAPRGVGFRCIRRG